MSPNSEKPSRLVAIDWMRGFVMVLMVLDHASVFFNTGRVSDDSAAVYKLGSALPPEQFFTRWVTHLCAPTFLFLSGTALALSAARRQAKGQSAAQIDRDLLIRGVIIVALDLVYMSVLAQHLIMQVLYAIGMSMIAMVFLRRLSNRVLLALSIGWFVGGEALTALVWSGKGNSSLLAALTVARSADDTAWIFYPFIPWLSMMALGWVFGNHLVKRREAGDGVPTRLLVVAGLISLVVFVGVRGLGGYGDMFLHAEDSSLVQWLHVSKYPPSLTFVTLELGLMALFLAFFVWLEDRVPIRRNGPLLVFGQTALFFYLLHFTALGFAAMVIGVEKGELQRTYLVAGVLLGLLYPPCWLYRRYKQANPTSLARFI
jgi:uncharacterized membrane protein